MLAAIVAASALVSPAAPSGAALPRAEAHAARPECPQSQPDAARALASAGACAGRVEILASKTETTRVFAEADGSRTAEVHAGIQRVRDEQGGWREVDLNLQRRPDGSVAAKVHPTGLVLAGATGAGEHDLAVLGKGGEQVTVGWRGRLPEPVLDGTKATYADVKPGVDLVMEATRTGFESFLVVKDRAAAAQVSSIAMPWRTGSLAAKASGRAFDLKDKAGQVRGQLNEAFMWDAAINPISGEPARRRPVGLASRAAAAGKTDLVLTPDAAFLNDPATEYPVVIDPQWDIWAVGGHHDTWVQTDGGTGWNSVQLKVGTYNGGGVVARSFIYFDATPFYNTYINWATLWMYETWAYSCRDAEWQLWTTGYADHTTNWWNQPPWLAYQASSWQTTGYDSCEGDGWVGIDARGFFQGAADANYAYYNIGLLGSPEWHNDTWKRFRSSNSSYGDPQVTINFNYPPWVGDVATVPSMPCVIGSGRPHASSIPQLQSLINDPEGDQTTAQYEWWVTGGSSPIASTQGGPAAAGAWQPAVTIPAADLPDGGTYSWRVRGHDGHKWSGWSGWCEFTLDSQQAFGMSTSPPSPCAFTASPTDTASLPRLNTNNGGAGVRLRAKVNDINGGATQAQFEWAPKTSGTATGSYTTPAPGLPVGSTFEATVPAGTFTDGVAYSWRVRGYDGGFAKPWSQWCEFVGDTSPPQAPTVTPDPGNDLVLAPCCGTPGQPGERAVVGRPTQVRFAPAPGNVIVGYLWGLNSAAPDRWAPAGPDGTAVVTIEPIAGGFATNQLTVFAVDRAGNRSALPAGQAYSYGFKANAAAGWWPTTGSAGPIDDVTSNGNDLTLTGGATLARGVLTLDGTGFAAAGGPAFDTTGTFTVAAWVRPTNLSQDRVVISQDGTSESAFRLMYRPAANAWCFALTESDVPPDPPLYTACGGGAPVVGTWVHLAGVYDADTGELRLYVNGALVATQTFTAPWPADGPFVVGRAQKGALPVFRFVGDIADVRAWSSPLDAAGIAALAKLPPSAGQWGMDDPASAIAPDLSGLAADHDTTFSGGAGWAPGHTGYGVNLDGVTGRGLTTGPVLRTNESFTVSAWVRLAAKGSYSRVVLAQAGTNLSAFYLGWDFGSDRWAFTMPTPDTSGPATWQYVLSTASPPTNTWVHLAGVYDKTNGTVRLYVNGVSQGVRTGVTAWNATGALRIGDALENALTRCWAGDIDDVRVFTGALSDAQIAYLATL